MKRSSYGEHDYAFGQMMLTLRTHIGLTQAGLAELLHVSRRAVAEWEAGSSYPKAEHLKQLILLPAVPLEESQRGEVPAAEPTAGRRVDWGEALAVPTFYGRER